MREEKLEVQLIAKQDLADINIEDSIYELNSKIDMLSPHADKWDYFIAAASGIVCGMIDVLWVGDFDLARGREFSSEKVEDFVKKTAKIFGCKEDDVWRVAVSEKETVC